MCKETPFFIFVISVMVVGGLILLAAYFCFRMACVYKYAQREDVKKIPDSQLYRGYQEKLQEVITEIETSQYKEVCIPSFDGFELYGRLIERNQEAPVMISFHGFHGTYAWDGYGAYKISKALGWNLLMVDMRAHGKSESEVITFGIRERYDCRDWVNYVIGRYGSSCRIILSGVSMGAATILLAVALGLPQNVKALIADCGFTDAPNMLMEILRKKHLPPRLMYLLIKLGAFVFGHVNLDELTAEGAVATNDIPTIFVHGDMDSVVPIRMQEQLYESCGKNLGEGHGMWKEKIVVPGADHANSALVDYPSYEEGILAFLDRAVCQGYTPKAVEACQV